MEENKYKKRPHQNLQPSHLRRPIPPRPSNKIWMFRKKRHLGQKQTAFLMGLHSVAYLSRYERGEKLPNLVNAMKLAKALSTSINSLYPELDAQLDREIIARRDRLPTIVESL